MFDDPTGKRGLTHFCSHVRTDDEYNPYYGRWFSPLAGTFVTYSSHHMIKHAKGLSNAVPPPLDATPSRVPANWESWSAEAWSSMKPAIKQKLSLVNFVVELKDALSVKQFFTNLKNLAAFFFNLLKGNQSFRHRRKVIGLSTAKQLSGLHLQYSFGVAPFIGDVIQIIDAIVAFRDKYADLVANAGKPVLRHYQRQLTSEEVLNRSYGISYEETLQIQDTLAPVVYRASARYAYRMPPEGKWIDNQCKYLLDFLGVKSNPRIVWDAIPFSFVLDWAFGVGSWLSSLETRNLELEYELSDFGHSYSETVTTVVHSAFGSPASTVDIPLCTRTTRRYLRKPSYPAGARIRSKLPTGREFALGLSLIVQTATKKVRNLRS